MARYDTEAINNLNDLAIAYDKVNALLVKESMSQSAKLNYKYGLIGATCSKGASFQRRSKFDSALVYLNRGLQQSREIKWPKMAALALGYLGDCYKQQGEYDKAMPCFKEGDSIAFAIGDKYRVAFCRGGIGDIYRHRSDFYRAQEYYTQAMKFATEMGVKTFQAYLLETIGDVYRLQNDYATALNYYNQALEMAFKINSKPRMLGCYEAIGDVYRLEDDTTKSFAYFNKAIPLCRELKDDNGIAFCYSLMGDAYISVNNYTKAYEYYSMAMELSKKVGSKNYMAFLNAGIAETYFHSGYYKDAIDYYLKALSLDSVVGDKNYISLAYKGLGEVYLKTGDFQKAKKCLALGLQAGKEANSLNDMSAAAETSYELAEKMNDYKTALDMHKLYMQMKDSESSTSNVKKFAAAEYRAKEITLKAEQEKEKAVLLADDARKEAEVKKQKILTYGFIGGFLSLLLFAIFIYRSLQRNRKQTQIISEQKELVETKNKEILDSITYAKRLQDAILPHPDEIKKHLPHSFILYKPKDIVAGDFYWMWRETTSRHSSSGEVQEDLTLIAACDCTGHGVPGAMVSVVCSNVLNSAVKEFGITEPGKILDKARELLIETFEKSGNDVADGMDISLCSINTQTGEVQWSGANNSLWYAQDNVLKEIDPDKQPIGKYENAQPFTTHKLQLKKGDTLYLFTDGYADQFGGPKGKKFKYKQLQELMVESGKLPMEEQKLLLEKSLTQWQGGLEQVDDILIMGIQL
jgi:tetratricopeptide (TPR) repeat protein